MQLQRSLFSFYRLFVKKTPLLLWGLFGALLLVIISWETGQLIAARPMYNFDECMMQFFNVTRAENDIKLQLFQSNKTSGNGPQNRTEKQQTKEEKKPYFLQNSYYSFLNQTSTIKVYLSDKIFYDQGQPNCRIILNTQKLRPKSSSQSDIQSDKADDNSEQQQKQAQKEKNVAKQVKIFQQIELEKESHPQTDPKDKPQQTNQEQKAVFSLVPHQLPPNIRNFDQITNEQHQFLLNQHSFMHITGNQHVAYLDQSNQFEQKHNVQIHAIFLSKQSFEEYPISWLGISSKFWRLHGNQLITQNGIMLRTMGETFLKVSAKIKQLYEKALFNVNLLIAAKKLKNQLKTNETQIVASQDIKNVSGQDKKIGTEQDKKLVTGNDKNQGNLVKESQTGQKKQIINQQQQIKQAASNERIIQNQKLLVVSGIKAIMDKLPNQIIPLQIIYPLSPLKLYFHYPQTLRIQDISKLADYVQNSSSLFYKVFSLLVFYCQLLVISAIIGLLVRYLFFAIATVYLFMGGCHLHPQWGWVQKYYRLIKNRFTRQNALSSVKVILLFALALVGSLFVFTFGIKYILQNIVMFSMSFSETYYAEMLLKNYFLIEMFFFVCCRTRVGLKFFPLFSLASSILILFANEKFYCYQITQLMNLHLLAHLFLMTVFIGIENYIGKSEFYSDFTPSQDKPRALYYAAYDISWQNTLPPIWTYFTTYFDWRYFGERQRVLINKDYQMLYGRLLGMHERQQLPEDEQDHQDERSQLNESRLSQNEKQELKAKKQYQKIQEVKTFIDEYQERSKFEMIVSEVLSIWVFYFAKRQKIERLTF